jgi:TetR/AcrR family transcriptional regulator, repressor for uid operon
MTTDTRVKRRAGRPPGSNAAQTRQRITRAAQDVFRELGYAGTTNKTVADRAGLTRPTINYHFESKQALFRCVIEANAGVVESTTSRLTSQEPTLRGRLRELTTSMCADPDVGAATSSLMAAAIDCDRHPELRSVRGDLFTGLRRFLVSSVLAAVECGDVRADVEASSLADAYLAVLSGLALNGGGTRGDSRSRALAETSLLLLTGELFSYPGGSWMDELATATGIA